MLAMLVARPISVEPSSSSPSDGCDSSPRTSPTVALGAADVADSSVLGPSPPRSVPGPVGRVEVWGRDAGDVSFSGRKTIYYCGEE